MILMATSCHVSFVGMRPLLKLVYVDLYRATGNPMTHGASASRNSELEPISSIIVTIEAVYEENLPRHFQYTCSRSFFCSHGQHILSIHII